MSGQSKSDLIIVAGVTVRLSRQQRLIVDTMAGVHTSAANLADLCNTSVGSLRVQINNIRAKLEAACPGAGALIASTRGYELQSLPGGPPPERSDAADPVAYRSAAERSE